MLEKKTIQLVNSITGEVKEKTILTRPEVKFRSITDLKGFEDKEVFEPDTSETEQHQAINIKAVYERCLRGEMVIPNGDGTYAIRPDMKMSIDEAFETLDITDTPDFDLADVTAITGEIAERAKTKTEEKEELSTTSNGADNYKSSDDASAVGNSSEIDKSVLA